MNKDVCMTRSWSLLVLMTVVTFSYMVMVVLEKPLYGKHCRLAIRLKGLVVFNAASSSIEALPLPSGRTAHSTLTVPIEINEALSLMMEKDSPRADLVRAAKLIIWDEAPMMH